MDDRPAAPWPLQDPPDPAAVAAEKELADELRRIINRLVLVRPPAEELVAAAEGARQFADLLDGLRARVGAGPVSEAGLAPLDHVRHSPQSGTSNPLAPPVELWDLDERSNGALHVGGRVCFGAAYEGPPGHVHGGHLAAMFDELLGKAQRAPGFTARLTVNYRQPAPLHKDLTLRGWVDSLDGRKRIVKGTCHRGDVLLAEADGLFLAPKDRSFQEHLEASLARHASGAGD